MSYFKACQILKENNMIKPSVAYSTEEIEKIISIQFRVFMPCADFVKAYEEGNFTKYLSGRMERIRFYKSPEWLALKKEVIALYGPVCMKTGKRLKGSQISVDHIVSIHSDPSKKLDITNLQILSLDENISKSSSHSTDYRTEEHKRKLAEYLEGKKA